MVKRLALLLWMSLVVCAAHAQGLSFNHSGFLTYTYFSDEDWFPSEGRVAVNVAAHYDEWAIKAQVSDDADEPLRRLALEYSTGVFRDNLTFQVGRVPRLSTLYADVYGAPDAWGQSVLPLATYNRRMVHSTSYAAIDGLKVIWDHNRDWGGVRFSMTGGEAVEEDQCDFQNEARKGTCTKDLELQPNGRNYDASLETRIGVEWTLLASYTQVSVTPKLIQPTRFARTMTRMVQRIDYDFARVGLRYEGAWGYMQGEHGDGRVHYDTPIGYDLVQKARDDYVTGGYYLGEDWTVFAGYSTGHVIGSEFVARDRYAGAKYKWSDVTLIGEYHNGNGSWKPFDSNKFSWDSWVFSATYAW